jgi:solute carrier family 35 protein
MLFHTLAVVQAVIKRRMPSISITLAVVLVVTGGVVAGIGDMSFNVMGYTFALLSCTTQAAYLLLVEFHVSNQFLDLPGNCILLS